MHFLSLVRVGGMSSWWVLIRFLAWIELAGVMVHIDHF